MLDVRSVMNGKTSFLLSSSPTNQPTIYSCMYSLTAQTIENLLAMQKTRIPGLGRSLREGNGYPLQYSCLENSMDRGAWWATVHGVAKSQA